MGQKKTVQNSKDLNDDQLDRYKFCYEQVNNWIENADNKINISCAIFSGIFGVITYLSEKTKVSSNINECWRHIHHFCFILGISLIGLSILIFVLAISPNLGSTNSDKSKKFVLYFGDIANMKNDSEHKLKINSASSKDFINELQSETYYNSKICYKKMILFKIGLWLSFLAIAFASVSWVAKFYMYR